MNCGDCYYFKKYEEVKGAIDGYGSCLRYPPILVRGNVTGHEWWRTETNESFWCGEWEDRFRG